MSGQAGEHRYVLLLGSGTGEEARLRRARDGLKQHGRILARSGVVHAPSVVPGDGHQYVNQALLFSSALPRGEFAPWLKSLESRLGRTNEDAPCIIDIDLVGERDSHGASLWEDPAKLDHALFRELVAKVVRS
ncbi:MAG: 2-amino-4-hydroxy-6-hydroxymethyldihydropteridine diphosphokinase [Pseudoxanthomonas sp.]